MKRQLLILWLTTVLMGAAAQPYYNVRRFSLRDGLASNAISSMEQTSDQLMWFSSWNGLNCYDGYTFTTFNDHTGHERTLTTNRLLKVTPSASGNIWCLTYDRQVFLFNRSTCRFVNVTSLVTQVSGRPFVCQRILSLANGCTWLFNREDSGLCFRISEQQGLTAEAIAVFSVENGTLPGRTVYGVETDAEGREWLCTDGGTVLVGSKLTTKVPYAFVRQVGQEVVLMTKDGRLAVYDGKNIIPQQGMPEGVSQVKELQKVSDRQWVALTNQGLVVYDTKRRQAVTTVPNRQGMEEICVDSRQRIWALTSQGDVLLTMADGRTEQLSTAGSRQGLKQSTRYLIHEDPYGTVWVATAQGFFGYYDEQSHSFSGAPVRTEAPQPTIDRWIVDSRGDLWFAGEHDLAVINFGLRLCNQTVLEQMQQVRSICYDSRGRLWTGDISGHIAVSTAGTVSYLGRDGQLHAQPEHFSHHVYCLYEDSGGRMWIGTKGDGLYSVGRDGRVSHYRHDESDSWSLPSDEIYDVYEDGQHRIWAGTFERGICLFEDGRFIHAGNVLKGYPVKDFFKVRRITETADGVIIVAASNGLVTFSSRFTDAADIDFFAHKHVPGDTTSLLTSDVMQACARSDGRVFVATVGGGVQQVAADKLLGSQLMLENVSDVPGDCGTILSMQEDRQGNLWMGREGSLAMYEVGTGRQWLFGSRYLGGYTELTEAKPAFNKRTGQIAFATTNGYVSLQPEQMVLESFVPPLVFKSAYFHATRQTVQLLSDAMLDVPAGQRNLTIHFAALDYQDNSLIRYAYKLEGVDRDWNDLNTGHSISFSHLPHGRHRLMVRSTNHFGFWAENDKVLVLDVHPTFWETWWAKLLYALLLAGVVAVAVWIYRLRTLAEQERQNSRMLSLLLEEMKTVPVSPQENVVPQPSERTEEETPTLRLRPTDIVDSDKVMMEQLLAYIEDNLANPDLKVEDLAQAVHLGRTAFYNKVKDLVGISPVELLRHVRIRHAEDMVAKSQEPFSQIAYAVGFSDAHYFGKCFKKQTGLTPSEYRERKA